MGIILLSCKADPLSSMAWFWKKDLRKSFAKKDQGWEAYSAKDSKRIEKAYQAGESNVKVNQNYSIHFQQPVTGVESECFQYRNDDESLQRQVKREELEHTTGGGRTKRGKKGQKGKQEAEDDDDEWVAKEMLGDQTQDPDYQPNDDASTGDEAELKSSSKQTSSSSSSSAAAAAAATSSSSSNSSGSSKPQEEPSSPVLVPSPSKKLSSKQGEGLNKQLAVLQEKHAEELKKKDAEIQSLRDQLAARRSELQTAQKEQQQATQLRQQAQEQLAHREQTLASKEQKLQQLRSRLSAAEGLAQQAGQLKEQLAQCQRQLAEAESKAAGSGKKLRALQGLLRQAAQEAGGSDDNDSEGELGGEPVRKKVRRESSKPVKTEQSVVKQEPSSSSSSSSSSSLVKKTSTGKASSAVSVEAEATLLYEEPDPTRQATVLIKQQSKQKSNLSHAAAVSDESQPTQVLPELQSNGKQEQEEDEEDFNSDTLPLGSVKAEEASSKAEVSAAAPTGGAVQPSSCKYTLLGSLLKEGSACFCRISDTQVGIGNLQGQLQVWNILTRQRVSVIKTSHAQKVLCALFRASPGVLVLGIGPHLVLRKYQTGSMEKDVDLNLPNAESYATSALLLLKDGRLVSGHTGEETGLVKVWELGDAWNQIKCLHTLTTRFPEVRDLAELPDGTLAVAGTSVALPELKDERLEAGTIELWSLGSNPPTRRRMEHDEVVDNKEGLRVNKMLAAKTGLAVCYEFCLSGDRMLALYSWSEGKEKKILLEIQHHPREQSTFTDMCWLEVPHQDQNMMCTLSWSGYCAAYDISALKTVAQWEAHKVANEEDTSHLLAAQSNTGDPLLLTMGEKGETKELSSRTLKNCSEIEQPDKKITAL
eukprot:g58907.t1